MLAVIFPGQGSHSENMVKGLFDTYKNSRLIFEQASDLLKHDLVKECMSQSKDILTRSAYLQAAVFTTSYAYYQLFEQEFGVQPACAAGHSLGEISAFTCSGGASFEDSLLMVAARGEIMSRTAQKNKGGMEAVIGLCAQEVESICKTMRKIGHSVYCANYNLPEQTVISGDALSLEKAAPYFIEAGAQVRKLSVAGPFHSPLMRCAEEEFASRVKDNLFLRTKWPFFCSGTAYPILAPWAYKNLLIKQITRPVYWSDTIDTMYENSIRIFVEIGPGHTLKHLLKKQHPDCYVFAMEDAQDRMALHSCFERMNVHEGHKFPIPLVSVVSEILRIVISLKHRGVQGDEFEPMAAMPYEELLQLQKKLETEGYLSEKQFQKALGLFQKILQYKGAPIEFQRQMMQRIGRFAGIEKVSGIIL